MIDYSFIRLKTSFEEAKDVQNQKIAQIVHTSPIQILPCDKILQITNLSSGIAFDGNYKAELIDCSNEVLADITSNIGIYEFTDINGVNQIAFELAYLNVDFGFNPVYLKLTHTAGNDIYYSNAFFVTSEYSEYTTLFNYKNYDEQVDFMKSIRLITYFDIPENDTEVTEYYQFSTQNTIASRAQYKQRENYKFDYVDRFTYERTNIMFINDVIYADEIRITNKPQLKGSERQGFSNFFESTWNCYKNYNESYTNNLQIVEPLSIIDKSPEGNFTLASLPTELTIQFNKSVVLGSGNVSITNSENTLIAVLLASDFTNVDGLLTADLTGLITENEDYTFTISDNFVSTSCENFDNYSWSIHVGIADFLGTDFNNNDFFTN